MTQHDNSKNIIFINHINLISSFHKRLKINIIFINFVRNAISFTPYVRVHFQKSYNVGVR